MAGHWTGEFSYVKGVVRYKDLAYVSLIGDEVAKKKHSQSILVEWDAGTWRGEDESSLEWDTVGAALALKPLEQALFLGEGGQVFCMGSGDMHGESVASVESSPTERGPMRGIRTIGERVYAVGMDRQVYRRDASCKWQAIDKGARPKDGSEEVVGFESIDGFDEQEIYAVGWDGEIWLYNGRTWKQKDSPTNMVLVDVCCGGDGQAYACGRVGTLVRGRANRWAMVEHQGLSADIWSLAWYRDKLYFSTTDGVFTLRKGDRVQLEDLGKDAPSTCYHLSTRDGVLWSIGAKDVMAFDGKKWTRID